MRVYYVYGLYKENYNSKTIDDGLYYVGITHDLKRRFGEHVNRKNINPIKKNYIKKYGCDIRIIWRCDSEHDAIERENFLINYYGCLINKTGFLTNVVSEIAPFPKNNTGKKVSPETRKKMSNSAIERSKSVDYLDRQRQSHLNRNGYTHQRIIDILEEWEKSHLGIPITKNHILEKYNIKKSRFNWWIKKYRPDLVDFVERNRQAHIERWRESGLTQCKYADLIGVDPRTISLWYNLTKNR